MNLEKVYDKVDWSTVREYYSCMEHKDGYWKQLKAFYENSKNCVRVGKEESELSL